MRRKKTAYGSTFCAKVVSARLSESVERSLEKRERSSSDQSSADRSCGQKSGRCALMRNCREVKNLREKDTKAQPCGPQKLGSKAAVRANELASWQFYKESGNNSRNEPNAP